MVSVVFESDGILHIVSAAWEATVNRLVFYGVTAPLIESTPTTWQVRRSPVTHLWAVATTATERLEAGASVIRHHAAGADGTVFAVPGTPYQCTVSPIGSESESPCAVAREYATLMTQIAFTNASGPVRVAGIVPQLAVLWADAVGARAKLQRELAAEDAIELTLGTPNLGRVIQSAPDELRSVLRESAQAYLTSAAAPWTLARLVRGSRAVPGLCDHARDHLRKLVAA